jgi:hypothetical protein
MLLFNLQPAKPARATQQHSLQQQALPAAATRHTHSQQYFRQITRLLL